MEIHNEILTNINTRYVLLKKENDYLIIDKLRKTMVIIDDPIINLKKLIEVMISKKVQVYEDAKELPKPIEEPQKFNIKSVAFKVFIKKIYNHKEEETGSILTALTNEPVNAERKNIIEKRIMSYAFQVLYPGEGLNMYSSVYKDTASITAIKKINSLPSSEIGNIKEIYDW
ncbi:hypothetical protein [Psychroserpens ponticola]|uniref:Uncharacterized protein n=1 Tax=Psychroserpens ponticola TaxID=2932268 RepID=A0ABY7S318_9FLAO|nr:hypothetical protein [Psychroserpens ponticola]WCO03574.1 hypothetical protein MUN68_008705 [Psychroserpens ponticola]